MAGTGRNERFPWVGCTHIIVLEAVLRGTWVLALHLLIRHVDLIAKIDPSRLTSRFKSLIQSSEP